MLFFPQQVFEGTQAGLILWIRTIFPALFPFMAGSGMMLSCGGLDILSRIAGPVFSVLFSTSRNGSYALITGFLCGYPMGAKTTADMVKRGLITSDEGKYLLSFCNNVSPSFILNFIVWKTLKAQELLVPTLLILMGVPAALSFIFRTVYLKGRRRFPDCPSAGKAEKAVSVSEAIDRSLTDSFESILKVGLYIIFFSVMISLLEAGGGTVASAVIPWLEISNGIWRLDSFRISHKNWLPQRQPVLQGSYLSICMFKSDHCRNRRPVSPVQNGLSVRCRSTPEGN